MKEKLKPHQDYDFVNHDKVFVVNQDGKSQYFELYYEEEVSEWLLVPFTDKHFTTPKTSEKGRTFAEPMSDYGYDAIERIADYEFDELD